MLEVRDAPFRSALAVQASRSMAASACGIAIASVMIKDGHEDGVSKLEN